MPPTGASFDGPPDSGPTFATLQAVSDRFDTPITALAATRDNNGIAELAWLTTEPSRRCVPDQKPTMRQYQPTTNEDWTRLRRALGELADHLVITHWGDQLLERLRADCARHNLDAPTFGRLQDINHWSGVARGRLRLTIKALADAYLPGHGGPADTAGYRAAQRHPSGASR